MNRRAFLATVFGAATARALPVGHEPPTVDIREVCPSCGHLESFFVMIGIGPTDKRCLNCYGRTWHQFDPADVAIGAISYTVISQKEFARRYPS